MVKVENSYSSTNFQGRSKSWFQGIGICFVLLAVFFWNHPPSQFFETRVGVPPRQRAQAQQQGQQFAVRGGPQQPQTVITKNQLRKQQKKEQILRKKEVLEIRKEQKHKAKAQLVDRRKDEKKLHKELKQFVKEEKKKKGGGGKKSNKKEVKPSHVVKKVEKEGENKKKASTAGKEKKKKMA